MTGFVNGGMRLITSSNNHQANLISERAIISIAGNGAKSLLTFITGMLLAIGLGPEDYGVFAFLLGSFTALRALLDMGTSAAFFSFISKRRRSRNFVFYYLFWLFLQFVISLLFIILFAPDAWIERIWEGESKHRIIIAFVTVFMQLQVWQLIAQIGESQRHTGRVQMMNVGIAVVHSILIAGIILLDKLTIELVLYFIILEFSIASIIAYIVLPAKFTNEADSAKDIFQEYKKFCLPMIPYVWLGVIMGFADLWLLQHYGGKIEQAYYSVAAQFGAISLLATTSILRVLWKEVAEANEKGDKRKVQFLFNRATRILFLVGILISGFLIPWAGEVINQTLGEAYVGGTLVMALMLLFPVHQSLGQINGTMFLALELTKPYVMIGMVNMIIQIIAVYFLLAPREALVPGLGLASTGLALKMVVLQFISVNVMMWWLARIQGWKYSIGYQILGMAIFITMGYVIYYLVDTTFSESLNIIVRGLLAFVGYAFFAGFLIYNIPSLTGLSRTELIKCISRTSVFIKKFNFLHKGNKS